MQGHPRYAIPMEMQRLAEVARRQGAPPTFFQIIGTGAWCQGSVKSMRRAETNAVDRAQGLLRGEEDVFFFIGGGCLMQNLRNFGITKGIG